MEVGLLQRTPNGDGKWFVKFFHVKYIYNKFYYFNYKFLIFNYKFYYFFNRLFLPYRSIYKVIYINNR